MQTGAAFLAMSREYLTGHYLPKIRAAVERLTEEDTWWRPNEASNSVGNLMLHLAGNIRQWIVSGVGGAPDVRDRSAEFARRDPLPRDELVAILTEGADDASGSLRESDQRGSTSPGTCCRRAGRRRPRQPSGRVRQPPAGARPR